MNQKTRTRFLTACLEPLNEIKQCYQTLTIAYFLSFKRFEGVSWAFRPEDEVKYSNDPKLKFDGGSFEPLKNSLKIFFTGSESKIIRVGALY